MAMLPSFGIFIYLHEFENQLHLMLVVKNAFPGNGIMPAEFARTMIYCEANDKTNSADIYRRYISFHNENNYENNLISEKDPDNMNVFIIQRNQNERILEIQTEFIEYVFGIHGVDFKNKNLEINMNQMYEYLPRLINNEMTKVLNTSKDVKDVAMHFYTVLMKESPFIKEAFIMSRELTQELQLGETLFLLRRKNDAIIDVSFSDII